MSDLTKSNFQAFGAGLIGFVAVVAIGGGFLYIHNSHNKQTGPVAAGAPIDLASPVNAPAPVSRFSGGESRPQSPAPLIGDQEGEESASPAQSAQSGAVSAPSAGGSATQTPRLVPGGGVDGSAAATSAELRFKDKVVLHEDKTAADPKKVKAAKKPVVAGETVASSVHYGVTSRSELMGRAAGPVYNFSGGTAKKGSVGQMAGDVGQRIAQLREQLKNDANLKPEDREKLQKELDGITKTLETAAGKTAQ